jgi:VanZ family protein
MQSKKKLLVILFPIAWMALIYYLSSLQDPAKTTGFPFEINDKTMHFIFYGVLGGLVWNVVRFYRKDKLIGYTALICGIYGLSDELHQIFVPGRSCDILDLLADILGAVIISTIVSLIWRTKNERKSRN